jgi:hypothetical protein
MSGSTVLTPSELLDAISGAWASTGHDAALGLAESQEHHLAARPPCAEDAESCRQAMLAAVRANSLEKAAAWRVRAISRFVAVGWISGLAAVMMTELYRVLELANDGYSRGRTLDVLRSSAAAHAVLDELPALAEADMSGFPFGPDPSLIHRFVAEKRGLLYCLERDYERAADCYARALLVAEGDPRGLVKVRAGALLAEYLEARGIGTADPGFAERTKAISTEATLAGQDDVAGWAAGNARAIKAGSPELVPYEML